MSRSYSYSFKYLHGGSMPVAHLPADSDDHFFKKVVIDWEKETGFKYVPDTVFCTAFEYRKVPEPLPAKKLAPGEYDLAAAARDGIRMPGLSILEG